MSFAERLKQARKLKGWTQAELGKAIGVSNSSIGGYEAGTSSPSAGQLAELANALEVDPNFLLQDEMASAQDEDEIESRLIARDVKNLEKRDRNVLKEVIKSFQRAGQQARDLHNDSNQ